MNYAIISDIHSNLTAFKAIIGSLEGVDRVWCLGDVVGYGPEPNQSIELLKQLDPLWITGNHDAGAAQKVPLDLFSYDARAALEWTQQRLTPTNLKHLQGLPLTLTPLEGVTLVHGSPRNPIWEYIFSAGIAEVNFAYYPTRIIFVGHTHIPVIFKKTDDLPCQAIPLVEGVFSLADEARYIVNPGSVGQPRDGDIRASFLLFDSEKLTVELHRAPYRVEETQEKMRKENLPPFLIERLAYGV